MEMDSVGGGGREPCHYREMELNGLPKAKAVCCVGGSILEASVSRQWRLSSASGLRFEALTDPSWWSGSFLQLDP